jgi:hypothetical protein
MHEPDVYPLAISALIVDPTIQRPLDRRRVTKIADALNLDAIGVITVSRRSNGDSVIIDGQHRVEALREAGYGTGAITCRVFKELTLAEEAAMFRLLNNTAKAQFIDTFRVRVIEGDPVAVDIVRMLEHHGWRIANPGAATAFMALAAFERIYRLEALAADKAIATLTRAWGHDPNAADYRIVEGLGLMHVRYGDAIEHEDLIDRLSKFGGGPGALLGKARGLRELVGSTVTRAVAEIVVELYNARRRTKALPPWRSS